MWVLPLSLPLWVAALAMMSSTVHGAAKVVSPVSQPATHSSTKGGDEAIPDVSMAPAGIPSSLRYFGFDSRPDVAARLGATRSSNDGVASAIIYVHAAELINGMGFPTAFSVFVESALSVSYGSVAIVVGGCKADNAKMRKAEMATKRILREIVDSFRQQGGNSNSNSNSNRTSKTYFSSSTFGDSDKNLAADVDAFFNGGDNAFDGASTAPTLSLYSNGNSNNVVGSASQDISRAEMEATQKYVSVADHFVNVFSQVLYHGSSSSSSTRTVSVSVGQQNINNLKVADVLSAFQAASGAITAATAGDENSNGRKVASSSLAMIKYRVWSIVSPIYRRNVGSLYHDAVVRFERESVKVPANSKLSNNLKATAAECLLAFTEDAKALRRQYADMLASTDSVYSSSSSSSDVGKGSGGRVSAALWGSMDLRTDSARLRRELAAKCADKVRTLWLQGLYNPYVRDAPWAPTHINFNYLIDPKALAFDAQYDGLYDAQEERICPNRADGIPLPGMATVVFDPNQHPVPLDDKPWWATLKDFYFSD